MIFLNNFEGNKNENCNLYHLKSHLNWRNRNRTRIEIIVLHSISDAKQRSLAFRKAASNTRKVILATNIAESSITVPDIKYGEFEYSSDIHKNELIIIFSSIWNSIIIICVFIFSFGFLPNKNYDDRHDYQFFGTSAVVGRPKQLYTTCR